MSIFKQKDRYKNYEYKYKRPSMFGGFAYFPPVIKALLISNVAIFIFQTFFINNFKIGSLPLSIWFMRMFALQPIGEGFLPWQLFTYLFMHGGIFHLLLNMFALWMFGMELENLWGSKKFLFYYFLCGVGAGLANLFISPLISPPAPTIGASGAVYGILVAFGMIFPDRPIFLYFLFPIRAKYFVIIFILIELFSIGGASNVAHFAHLGGAVVGFIYLMLSQGKFSVENLFQNYERKKYKPREKSRVYRNKYYEKFNKIYDDDITDAEYDELSDDKDQETKLQERIDEILDKISKEGYQNLTEEEKKILFEASKKLH